MDPSLSDPHPPPPSQFTGFPPYSNSTTFTAQNHPPPFYPNPFPAPPTANHAFQPPPSQTPPPPMPQPSLSHPPYSDMICTAIATLNEPDGSSKQAISRYIERSYSGIPQAHGALLTHHLKTLKTSGVLQMVKKSYKFAAANPPASLAVAAAAQAAGLEPPRSGFSPVNETQALPSPTLVASSTPQTQKRGRGRPPKAKPEVLTTDVVQTNGKPVWEQPELPVSQPQETQIQPQAQVVQQQQPSVTPAKRPPGRPRKDGSSPMVKAPAPAPASVSGGGVETAKRRGRPPSGRAVGRERKPSVVSAPVSVIPYVANGGVIRRGRPKRVDAGASSVAPTLNAEVGGEGAPIVVAKKRGRGRPPKIGGVIRRPMKAKRLVPRTGRPVGRPRKQWAVRGASGQQQGGDYIELKKKFELFQARVKDVVVVLKDEVGRSENPAVVQAIQSLEELTVEETNEPQHMEETTEPQQHVEETNEPQHMEEAEAEEEEERHGAETEEQGPGQGQGQPQTEAEAMHEALF